MKNIRNFAIIAHIDHGKSTLADRIIELCGGVKERDKKNQLLDNMDLERERGITIKLNTACLKYKDYELNLIDTPGHVDFSYEVSRSLAACEGVLLLVDATQGVQAQTIANLLLAREHNLVIIPVINKIDLVNANLEKTEEELVHDLGFKKEEIIKVSAKTGLGVDNLVEEIIKRIPFPKGNVNFPLQALIFDSVFDNYQGVIIAVRVFNGLIRKNDDIYMKETNTNYKVLSLFKKTPMVEEVEELKTGEVGFIVSGIKAIKNVKIGDTITHLETKDIEALPGYKKVMPMVYSGIFPVDGSDYDLLRESMEKLALNDSALQYTPEKSSALGFGFRAGFLGLLHLEVVKERLEREFQIDIIVTTPSVLYKVFLTDGSVIDVDSPSKLPEQTKIRKIEEPFIEANIFTPNEYIGDIMKLCQDKRGIYKEMIYLDQKRVKIIYDLPLLEIIVNFFDKLKSLTKGFASFNYEFKDYRESRLVKLDILVNKEKVDALSTIVHIDNVYNRGRELCEALKEEIPRSLFEVVIQAAVNNKIIARETVKALRKDVLAKCYGGDITRKKKLLEKQKRGKKKMKEIGNVSIPGDAFLRVLKDHD